MMDPEETARTARVVDQGLRLRIGVIENSRCPSHFYRLLVKYFPIMIARRHIIPNKSQAHVFFRCYNRQFFLKPSHIKEYLVLLLARYKKKIGRAHV